MTITEKELIAGIKELRQIKPDVNWVFSVKNRIFCEEKERRSLLDTIVDLLFQPKVALAGVSTLAILFGILFLSQDSLPGDYLYVLKRTAERGQEIFVFQNNIAHVNLKIANKRLDELTKIAQSKQAEKIVPALQEYRASIAEAAKNLIKTSATTSDSAMIKNIVFETQKLEENMVQLERIYGIAGLDAKQGENPVQLVADWLIKDLKKRTLTDEQELLFEEAKKDYNAKDYNSALEKILKLSEN